MRNIFKRAWALTAAGAALTGLRTAWRDWSRESGPLADLPPGEAKALIALGGLLNPPRPGAIPDGWLALLEQAADLTRRQTRAVSARLLGWQALHGLVEETWQRWAATMLHAPDVAATAARQGGILHLAQPDLGPAAPPTDATELAQRHSYLVRTAQRVLNEVELQVDDSPAQRTLHRLLQHLAHAYAEVTAGISPVLPAVCHQIGALARQTYQERGEDGQFGHGDLLQTLAGSADWHARRLQSLVDEADPDLQQEADTLTEQALADEQLLTTIRCRASWTAEMPQAPALWAWLQQRADGMSPRLRRALRSDLGPRGDFVGLFGRMWHTLLDAAPADAPTQLSPLPAADTPVPRRWQPFTDQVLALADAASSDIDLRLRLTGSLGDDPEELISRFTENYLTEHRLLLPAAMTNLYFRGTEESTFPSDDLHTYLLREVTERLSAAPPRERGAARAAQAPPAARARQAAKRTPAPDTQRPGQSPDGQERDTTGLSDALAPGLTLEDQALVIRTVIDHWAPFQDGSIKPGSPLAMFVRRMDDPPQWQAWRDGLVAARRGADLRSCCLSGGDRRVFAGRG